MLKIEIRKFVNRLLITALFALLGITPLVAQTLFSETTGTTKTYHIDKQPTITTYTWGVYSDANLATPVNPTAVTISTLGPGRENEVQVAWNQPGNYYLGVIVEDAVCSNKTAFHFNVTGELVNNPPLLANDANTTFENRPITQADGTGSLLINDTDPDNDPLIVTAVNGFLASVVTGIYGSLTWNSNGNYTYTPNAALDSLDKGEVVTEIFNYTVSDGRDNGTATATLTITINGVDKLLAVNDAVTLHAGETRTLDVLTNDFFAEAVTLRITSLPKHAITAITANNAIQYTALTTYIGTDTLVYSITNSAGTSTAQLIVSINPQLTLTTNTYCVDETPYFSWNVDVIGPDITGINLQLTDANGQLIQNIENAQLTGTMPWPGTSQPQGTFYATGTALETISISAEYIKDAIIETVTTSVGAPKCHINTIYANIDFYDVFGREVFIDVLANDEDPDEGNIDPTTLSIVKNSLDKGPYHGQAVINSNGTISYIPQPGYAGIDSFIYQVCDDLGACDTAKVILELFHNDKLVANNDYFFTYKGQARTFNPTKNDNDPDGLLDLASLVLLSNPDNGQVTLNGNGEVTYTPNTDFVGTDRFKYGICDNGTPQECDSAWVNISVNENRMALVLADNAITSVQLNHPGVIIDVLANDYDPEEELDSTSLKIQTQPTNGIVEVLANHSIKYTPTGLFVGTDQFEYQICDSGFPVICNTGIVSVQVIDNNKAILALRDDINTPQNQPATIPVISNDVDTDGIIDLASLVITRNGQFGTAVLGTNGTLVYTPNRLYVGNDTLVYRVCDNGPIVTCDTAMVVIKVMENVPPVAVADAFEVFYASTSTFNVAQNDFDAEQRLDALSVVLAGSATKGELTIDATGLFSYSPNNCSFGTDSFTYRIYDVEGNVSNLGKVVLSIAIDPTKDTDADWVNDINEDLNQNGNLCDDDTDGNGIPNYLDTDDDGDGVLTNLEDWNKNGNPADDDTDADGKPNFLDDDDDNDCVTTKIELAYNGGNYLFDLDKNEIPNILDNDDNGDGISSCEQKLDLDGNGIIDLIEIWNSRAVSDFMTVGINTTALIPVLQNDSTTMDPKTLSIITMPVNGLLAIDNSRGAFTYTPDIDFVGLDSFIYEVCDYYETCDSASVMIKIDHFLDVPNLFTPNGDGYNDKFVIRGLEKYINNKLTVVNRWGSVVFESINYKNDWDGTSNVVARGSKKLLPFGTYFYYLSYGQDKFQSGSLFLEYQ